MLKMELQRAFNNKKLYFSLLVGIVIATIHFFRGTFPLAYWMMEIKDKTEIGIQTAAKMKYATPAIQAWMGIRSSSEQYLFFFILPILAAIPYAASFCGDKKSGYLNNIITRGEKKTYFRAKLLSVFLTGGIVAVVPLIFNLLLCMCFLPLGDPISGLGYFGVVPFAFLGDLYYTNVVAYIILYLIFDFVFFGSLTCLALLVTYLDENRFFVLMTPFIIWFASNIFVKWFVGKSEYSPHSYTNLPNFVDGTQGIVFLQVAVLMLLVGSFLLGSKHEIL